MNDGIDCDKYWNNGNGMDQKYMSKHELVSWNVKYIIDYGVVAIDNYNCKYQTLRMKWFKEKWIIIYWH